MPRGGEARFKGRLGIGLRKATKEILAAEGRDRDRFLAALPEELRGPLTERYVATVWYPTAPMESLFAHMAKELGAEPEAFARRLGATTVNASAGPMGRSLIALIATPPRLAKYANTVWRQLHDEGRLDARFDRAEGRLVAESSGWSSHGPLTCLTTLGSMEAIAERMRGYEFTSSERETCVSAGSATCRLVLRFRRT
ncbi:MAG: hypothetical protein AAF447_20655 [Myxococcota bacterium]